MSVDVEKLAHSVGISRAKFDLTALGHFDNRYRADTPEHEGYESFAAPILERMNRTDMLCNKVN